MAGKNPWDKKRLRLQFILKQARLDAGLKQEELAALIDADQSFVSRYERGERRLDLIELDAICRACGLPMTELLARYQAE